MIIGIPCEIKANEWRVAMTPNGVALLKQKGHTVYVQKNAGIRSGFSDEEYIRGGAVIVETAEEIYEPSNMIVKVKEPLPSEYKFLRKDQILCAYLHLAVERTLTQELMDKKVTTIALETVADKNGNLPLLMPLSEIAGKMSVQIAANLLENKNNGSGILLGGVVGVPSGKVLIIGAGTVGINAARVAVGIGADVSIVDIDVDKLRRADYILGSSVKTYLSDELVIRNLVKDTDVLIGAVLVPGHKSPCLITEDMVKSMRKGSVIVDVSIDQGGIVETMDRITTHDNPSYEKFGIVHYSVANMPSGVAKTATVAMTNETIKYICKVANEGLVETIKSNTGFANGVNIYKGKLTHQGVAEAHNFEYTELTSLIGF